MPIDHVFAFEIETVEDGQATTFVVTPRNGAPRRYHVSGREQHHYAAFQDRLASDFGMRAARPAAAPPEGPEPPWRPLIQENLSPRILSGYGDPAVLKTEDDY